MKKFSVTFLDQTYPCQYLRGNSVVSFLESLLNRKSGTVAIDIETYGKDEYKGDEDAALLSVKSKIRTLQFFDGREVFILDFVNVLPGGELDNILDSDFYFDCLYQWLLRNKCIAHNALFETCHIQNIASEHGVENNLKIDCTMIAFRLIINALSDEPLSHKADLGSVTKLIVGETLEKDYGASDWSVPELSDEQIRYCAFDAIAPYFVFEKLVENLTEMDMEQIYNINVAAQPALAQMNTTGITIDKRHHKKLAKDWKKNLENAEVEVGELLNADKLELSTEELLEIFFNKVKLEPLIDLELGKYLYMLDGEHTDKHSLSYEELMHDKKWIEEVAEELKVTIKSNAAKVGDNEEPANNKKSKDIHRQLRKVYLNMNRFFINMASKKQVSDWLKARLSKEELEDWPLSEKTGHLKQDSDTMEELSHIPLIEPIGRFNTYSKLSSNYGEGLEKFMVKHPDDSYRIHGNFSLAFTGTGRLSSFKPNLQNQPARGEGAEIRQCYVARDSDRKLVCADYSQIEVRVAAMLSSDEVMLEAYETGVDIHKVTASRISGKSVSQVTKEDRQLGKACVFGLLFGAGPTTLRKYAKKSYGVEMDEIEANAAVETFRNTYPQLRAWQIKTASSAEIHLAVTTKMGKLRCLHKDRYYTTSMNTVVQGSAAECMLLSLICIYKWLLDHPEFDAELVCNIHDEVIVDCPKEYTEVIKEMVEDRMTSAFLAVFPDGTTRDLVESKVGNNWQEAK